MSDSRQGNLRRMLVWSLVAVMLPNYFLYAQDTPVTQDTPVSLPPVKPYLAKANVDAGRKRAQVCLACHSVEKDAPDKLAPNLWNIVGNKHADSGHFHFSDLFKFSSDSGKTWDDDRLNEFLFDPKNHGTGITKKAFVGIKDPKVRANIIAWLHTLADPVPPQGK